jgi:hypothetical protein
MIIIIWTATRRCKLTVTLFYFNWYSGGGGGWSSVGSTRHCGQQWPMLPAPGAYDDREIGGMIGRGNRSTRRKPALVPLCPPQTPRTVRTRTWPAAVGSQRLTAWPTARPYGNIRKLCFFPACHLSSLLSGRTELHFEPSRQELYSWAIARDSTGLLVAQS